MNKISTITLLLAIAAVICIAILCLSPADENNKKSLEADDDVLKPLGYAAYKVYLQSEDEDVKRIVGAYLPNASITDKISSDTDLIMVQSEKELTPELKKSVTDSIHEGIPVIIIGAAIDSFDSELKRPVMTTSDPIPVTKAYAKIEPLIVSSASVGSEQPDIAILEQALKREIIWSLTVATFSSIKSYEMFILNNSDFVDKAQYSDYPLSFIERNDPNVQHSVESPRDNLQNN